VGRNARWLGPEVRELWGSIVPKPDGARTAGELARLSDAKDRKVKVRDGAYKLFDERGKESDVR